MATTSSFKRLTSHITQLCSSTSDTLNKLEDISTHLLLVNQELANPPQLKPSGKLPDLAYLQVLQETLQLSLDLLEVAIKQLLDSRLALESYHKTIKDS